MKATYTYLVVEVDDYDDDGNIEIVYGDDVSLHCSFATDLDDLIEAIDHIRNRGFTIVSPHLVEYKNTRRCMALDLP